MTSEQFERDIILSEIKTLVRILNTWGNTLVPSLGGKDVTAKERLHHFLGRAESELGMTIEEIEVAIGMREPEPTTEA